MFFISAKQQTTRQLQYFVISSRTANASTKGKTE